jgi:hypothetical protein
MISPSILLKSISNMKIKDKQAFLLLHWKTDFPQYAHMTYEQICTFIGLSKQLGIWHLNIKEEFMDLHNCPDWYKVHEGASKWTSDFKVAAEAMSTVTKKFTSDIKSKSDAYKKDIGELREAYNTEFDLYASNAVLKIHFIKIADLPVNIIFNSLEKSEVSLNHNASQRDEYLKTELNKYKANLYLKYKNDPKNFDFKFL